MNTSFQKQHHCICHHSLDFFHFRPFSVFLRASPCVLGSYSSSCISLLVLKYIYVMFFIFSYLTPSLFVVVCFFFCFLCIQFFVCPPAFSSHLIVDFSLIILKCSVLFVLLDHVSVSFKSLFWFISSSSQTYLMFCFGLFIPIYTLVFFFP